MRARLETAADASLVGVDAWCMKCRAPIADWFERLRPPEAVTHVSTDGSNYARVTKAGACAACGHDVACVRMSFGF